MLARLAPGEVFPGMLVPAGRVVAVEGDTALVCAGDGRTERLHDDGLQVELGDRATFWLCLDIVARRTGLDATSGLLWQLQDDPFGDENVAWVLEAADEVRTRDGDTEDPEEALARALEETGVRT
jgi:hypothetical protein